MFGKIKSEFQCFDRKGKNCNVWKGKVSIPMFGRITSELSSFRCF